MSLSQSNIAQSAGASQEQSTQTPSSSAVSNAAVQEQMVNSKSAAAQHAAALTNYRTALGGFLGPKLYEAIADVLDENELKEMASSALGSSFRSLLEYAAENGENAEAAAVLNSPGFIDSTTAEFTQGIDSLVNDWLGTESGGKLVQRLRNWAGAHPYIVAGVAVMAAAAAILADMDVPELKAKFGLGSNLKASVGAKIGSFRNLALEQIRSKLEYSKGSLSAAAEVIQVQGGGTTANINGRYGTDEQHINGTVKLDEQGLTAYNIGGLYTFNDGATKLSGNAGSSNGEVINNIEVGIDHQSGATNHKGAAKYDPSNGSLSLSYDQLRDSGFQLGAAAKGNAQTGNLSSLSAYVGNQQDERYDQWMANYEYAGATGNHSLGVRGRKEFGDYTLSGAQELNYGSDAGFSSRSELMGGYRMGDKLSVIGGAEYVHDQHGGRMLPKIGVEYKDVPITITIDSEAKSAQVGFSFKF